MSKHLKQYSSHKYRRHEHERRDSRHRRSGDKMISEFDSRKDSHDPAVFSSDRQHKSLNQDKILSLVQSRPEDVLAFVSENESVFLAAYRNDKYCNKPITLRHMIKMLYILMKTDDIDRIVSRVLARLFSPDGDYAVFLCKLDQLIKEMVTEIKGYVRRDNVQYLYYLAEIGIKAVTIIPKTVLPTFPVLSIKETFQCLSRAGDTSNSLQRKIQSLESMFAVVRDQKLEAHEESWELSECSGHFSHMDILPSLGEILTDCSKLYLPPNIVKGAYRNWDHYLDVQYHLMREDFLRPFKLGIQHFISANESHNKRAQNIHVYENVRLQNPVCLFSGVGFQVQFDISHFSKVKWEYSKRLIFGSLLCLSRDGFKESITFATVVKNDPDLLKYGYITIKLEGGTSGFDFNHSDVFTMVESMAYFEAYRHTLSKLKEMSLTSDTIPFKRYIVDCQLRGIPVPSYSLHQRQLEFDLNCILNINSKVNINDFSSWPLPSSTCLDHSQLNALRMALTKEISVIQGPPGTGKTFIGLKVVEAFLRNRSIWDCNKEAPILVICYTNHALDQFLEGIQNISCVEHKPNIVRIGGRCKSKQLSSCILRNKVNELKSKPVFPRALLRGQSEAHRGMLVSKDEIHQLLSASYSADKTVRSLSELRSVMLDRHFSQLQALHNEDGSEMEVWLELCYSSNFKYKIGPEVKLGSNSGSDLVTMEFNEKGDSGNFMDCIDVDDGIQILEEDRAIEGEAIELPDPPKSKQPDQSICTIVQVGETKRRKVERNLKCKCMSIESVCSVEDLCSLPLERKWSLYNYWVMQCTQHATVEMRKCIEQYEQWCEKHRDYCQKIDEYVLHGSDVVGMTTTGAAKHHHILKSIHPKIVIFEEAAEIFETHIVTSLTPSVQQLILIGDHKQLRPKPNSYDLETKYGLALSFFERMVKNGIHFVTLCVQHRMRPEISSLIRPSIYPELQDHEVVYNYENICGIAKNVFMISHSQPEKNQQENGATSHANEFEAKFLVALCLHLFKQGYQPHQITILTMYRGQLFELRRRMTRETFEGTRVAVVDDFQGEENDIVLLSLVRSNFEKKIGFLDKSNRVCVCLSRAKKGLYIIGNIDMLRDKENTVWPRIINDLEQKGCVGKSLPLYCQVHRDSKVWAEFPEDFLKSPEGGCEKLCGTRLSCGHACPRICHPKDMNHQDQKCLKECGQILHCGHRCEHKCYECLVSCKPCSTDVKRVISRCNHEVTMACCTDPSSFICTVLCEKTLSCGHACQNYCSEPCTLKCLVEVNKELVCGHKVTCLCYQEVQCPQVCETILDCGDKCSGTCGECSMGRLHKGCTQNCGRQLVCGHTCNFPCASTCPPCMNLCNNFCIHSRCPKRCYEPCTPCMEWCQWKCKHFKCTARCNEICNRPPCDEPCEKTLECGHPCISLCGEKCPRLCRICDKEEVCDIFFGTEDEEDARFIQLEDCSHLIEVSSLDKYFEKDGEGHGEVKFIDCPKCRTPIRTSLRYCNKVKCVFKDVEQIKQKQLIPNSDLKQKYLNLKCEAKKSKWSSFIEIEMTSLDHDVSMYETLHPYRVNAILVQINILTAILDMQEILAAYDNVTVEWKSHFAVCDPDNIRKDLHLIKSFVFQEFLSNQQVLDVTSEARRVSCAAKLFDMFCGLHRNGSELSQEDKNVVVDCIQIVHGSGWKLERLNEEGETGITNVIKRVKTDYRVSHLSNKERIEIVKAVGSKKGSWYKCVNGHFYCIGQCGGAMETAQCPECGAVIGGQSHRLATGNEHAPEMDDSRHAAWSEGANMANFDLNIPL